MSLPSILQRLRIPVIASPMFIVSNPDLVIAQCKAGVVGSFPALNARPAEALANMPVADKHAMSFADNRPARAWKDIWGAGQGIGAVKEVVGAAELVDRLANEYAAARARLGLGAAA